MPKIACTTVADGRIGAVLHDVDDAPKALAAGADAVWLDMVDPGPGELERLRAAFDLHPLAIEDAQTEHERPKIEAYDRYVFLVVHPLTWEGDRLVTHEMSIFAGARFLVTIRRSPAYAVDEIARRWNSHDGNLGRDAGFLLYTMLDAIVDSAFPIGDRIEEWINELQTRLFERKDARDDKRMLREIFELKTDVHYARRAVAPFRDILQPLIRDDFAFFKGDEERYYRDVYDHAIRVIDQLDSSRDFVASALEIHLSLVANSQNEVAKQLAIIATIFLPLTYLTGFFGQNFGFMVAKIASSQTFLWLGVGSQAIGLVVLLAYFKYKRWF